MLELEAREDYEMENRFMVAARGDNIVILRPARELTRDDALNLAAWLLVLAGTTPEEREKAVAVIEET